MMPRLIPTLAIQLLVYCAFVAATNFNNDIIDTDPGAGMADRFETPEILPVVQNGNSPLSLTDILNQRANSKEDLCPTLNVMLFFRTGNLEFLRDCYSRARTNSNQKRPNDKQVSSTTSSSGHAQRVPVMASYSGRLLKRILQNIGDRPPKIDFTNSKEDGQKGVAEKRAPLSINGALSSLVDMLRYDTARDSQGPKYAFHQDFLHMG